MKFINVEVIASALFAIAILHVFCTSYFERLAQSSPKHSGLFHLLGEVEIVFGVWAFILFIAIWTINGLSDAKNYINSREYTEALFVFAIMVVAASKPILDFAEFILTLLSKVLQRLYVNKVTALYFLILSVTPLLGSFITEPAAMTLAALLLRDLVYRHNPSQKLMFASLGVLFVNVSIGGTLTNFAAPPVLMVASTWQWSSSFMLQEFGPKAITTVFLNAGIVSILFNKELINLDYSQQSKLINENKLPILVTLIHLFFLIAIVCFAHYSVIFIWLLLFFIGYTIAYPKYQTPLILKEALLVGFFLAGLITLGGLQQWWLQPILENMHPTLVFYGSLVLTAFTDNAALTYLGSLVDGTSQEFKVALVSGAVIGGGLTVIANAPNPAGVAILRSYFPNLTISAVGLFLGALGPTLIAIAIFKIL